MYGKIPKLCRHKGRNGVLRAYVTDPRTRREVYFGLWRTPEARAAYAAWLADYIKSLEVTAPTMEAPSTVNGLLSSYLEYAKERFRRVDGRTSSEYNGCLTMARLLRDLGLGDKRLTQFTRADMIVVRDHIVRRGLSRGYAHATMRRITRVFTFGEERDWVSSDQAGRLARWPRLRALEAPDYKEVKPAKVGDLWAYYKALPDKWKKLLALHAYLGCRTENACSINLKEVDRSKTPWVYAPRQQKLAWRGKRLEILIGPRARAIIASLEPDARDGYLFPGTGSSHMTANAYGYTLRVTHQRAGLPKVIARQIRHTAASYLLKRGVPLHLIGGVLGHSWSKTITANYATADNRDVASVVEKYG